MPLSLVFKSMLFTVLVPGTVTVLIPNALLSRSGGALDWPGLAIAVPAFLLIVSGTALYLRCARDFAVLGRGTPAPIDPPKQLVVAGFYRWTRNPMYQSVVLVLLAEALFFRSRELFAYAACVALVLHLLVVLYEEPLLRRQFGPNFAAYCRAVPRWGMGTRPCTPDQPEPRTQQPRCAPRKR